MLKNLPRNFLQWGKACEVPFRCISGVRASSRRTGEIPPVGWLVQVESGSCASWLGECGEPWRCLFKGPTIWICRQSIFIYLPVHLLCCFVYCYLINCYNFVRRSIVFVDSVHHLDPIGIGKKNPVELIPYLWGSLERNSYQPLSLEISEFPPGSNRTDRGCRLLDIITSEHTHTPTQNSPSRHSSRKKLNKKWSIRWA